MGRSDRVIGRNCPHVFARDVFQTPIKNPNNHVVSGLFGNKRKMSNVSTSDVVISDIYDTAHVVIEQLVERLKAHLVLFDHRRAHLLADLMVIEHRISHIEVVECMRADLVVVDQRRAHLVVIEHKREVPATLRRTG